MTEPENSVPEIRKQEDSAASTSDASARSEDRAPNTEHPSSHPPIQPLDDTQPPPPHMALGSRPVAKWVGIIVTVLVLWIFWLLWRGRELPFTEMRYQLSDSTGYQPLARQQYLMGSVPRSVNGRRAVPAHASLPDLPDGSIPAAAANLTSPYPVDGAAIHLSFQLYVTNCAMCHGDRGHGDGPVGESYIPRPPDLTGPEIAATSDGQIYYSITNGILSEPIPEAARYIPRDWHAFRQELSDRDRWALVALVRTIGTRHNPPVMDINNATP